MGDAVTGWPELENDGIALGRFRVGRVEYKVAIFVTDGNYVLCGLN